MKSKNSEIEKKCEEMKNNNNFIFKFMIIRLFDFSTKSVYHAFNWFAVRTLVYSLYLINFAGT